MKMDLNTALGSSVVLVDYLNAVPLVEVIKIRLIILIIMITISNALYQNPFYGVRCSKCYLRVLS